MENEFDFNELRNYLLGQMDMGEAELLLDEPWTLTKKIPAAGGIVRPVIPTVEKVAVQPQNLPPLQSLKESPASSTNQIPDNTGFTPTLFGAISNENVSPNAPAPRAVRRTASAFESTENLEAFYKAIKAEAFYVKEPALAHYVGPQNPKLLFLFSAIKKEGDAANLISANSTDAFFATEVGAMLVKLFESLNIDKSKIGITYFFKSTERPLAPLLEASLRKMLAKEISFINPELMVTFGQNLFHQVFGKGKYFDDLAGAALEFGGTKACALVDPYAMVKDKQMKWLTWKIHIPKSGFFEIKK